MREPLSAVLILFSVYTIRGLRSPLTLSIERLIFLRNLFEIPPAASLPRRRETLATVISG
jgi:hypothetical protein